jgi:hypothetical protein
MLRKVDKLFSMMSGSTNCVKFRQLCTLQLSKAKPPMAPSDDYLFRLLNGFLKGMRFCCDELKETFLLGMIKAQDVDFYSEGKNPRN